MARKKKKIEEVEPIVEQSEKLVNTTTSTDIEVSLPSEEINVSTEVDTSEQSNMEVSSEEVVKPIQRGTEIVINGKTYFQYTDSNGVTYTNPKV